MEIFFEEEIRSTRSPFKKESRLYINSLNWYPKANNYRVIEQGSISVEIFLFLNIKDIQQFNIEYIKNETIVIRIANAFRNCRK